MALEKVVVAAAAMTLAALAYNLVPTLADESIPPNFNRGYFPPGFIFGASSSAYQTEGAWDEDGKGPSIWDDFTHTYPDVSVTALDDACLYFWRLSAALYLLSSRLVDFLLGILGRTGDANGDVANDFYHRYKEDIAMMADNLLDAFRFSISWPRLLPNGKVSGGVNPEGVYFYNNVINECLKHGIQPWVTIYHWDVPSALENEYGGFRSKKIVEDYRNFARLCFELFGDRVKHWMTINEPWTVSLLGYAMGLHAPGRCSCFPANPYCNETGNGNAGTEPYIVTHHFLLAHAAAVQEYRKNFKSSQMGQVGFSLCSNWFLPINESDVAQKAVDLSLDWSYGWHLSPMTYGKYPDSMRNSLGSRLPEFTEEEKYLLIRSFDFVGVNYYGSAYAIPDPDIYDPKCLNYFNDYNVTWNGTIYGYNPAGLGEWANIYATYAKGIRYLLNYTMNRYENPAIYITENGVSDSNGTKDIAKMKFYKDHIWQVHKAIRKDGVNVKGFTVWSWTDSFEWSSGYEPKMGIIFVNRSTLARTPKYSAAWYKNFLNGSDPKEVTEPHYISTF